MKYLHLAWVLLALGLIVRCGPTASQSNFTGTSTNTPTPPILTATPTATHTPKLQMSNSTITPTKIRSVIPTPSASPTSQLTPSPTTAAAKVVAAASAERAAQVKYGLEIYQRLYCGLCHQLDAVGTAGTFGPPHNDMGTIAEQRLQEPQYTGQATTAAEYLHESIVDPRAFIVPGYENPRHQMPIYDSLNEMEVDALVQMLLQQK